MSFTINQNYTTIQSDTEIYGEHVCFGDTSANIKAGINNKNFIYGFTSNTSTQIPLSILNSSTSSAYPNLYIVNAHSSSSSI